MDINALIASLIAITMFAAFIAGIIFIVFIQYRKKLRERKNYERSLKMVPILIHLPPPSEDIQIGGRDARDVMDEMISQAQIMYDVILSTATKGFKSKLYGQRHISFEVVAHGGLIHYYAVVPVVLIDNIKQAIIAAYPTARLEEVEELNLFNEVSKIAGTLGGEFTLTKPYEFPIATYKDIKRDATGAILNALSMAQRGDGVGLQILLRPASDSWVKEINSRAEDIRDGKKNASSGKSSGPDLSYFTQIFEALWKPPTSDDKDKAKDKKPLSGVDQARVEAMEEKAKYAGYEVKIRLVASCANSQRSHTMINNVVSAFALFNSPTNNGFKFTPARNIEQFVTDYIMRFFPQEDNSMILNTIELASLFHLPDQTNVPSSQVERQHFKEVDGPSQIMDQGLLLGYNSYRGRKKAIRLSDNDRRRHLYVMGATGMGKSIFLENLALQDMMSGKGFAFIDPHGDSAEKLLSMIPKERVDDVVYFDPADMDNPVGMNLFEIDPNDPDPERTQDYIISETLNMLRSLYDPNNQGIVGPRMFNIVRNAALLLMADPAGGTFMDIPYVLTDPEYAKPKIKYLKNQRAINFWTKEWPASQRSNDAGEVTSWVVSKWADFENTMMSNILGQVHSSLNIREIMDNRKILLVNLSKGRLGEMPAKLLGMVFVMKFQAAAMSRANIPESERKDFCLFVDEFQNFATDSFESILSEARKYHLSLTVANQFITQLTDKIRGAIMGNTGSFVIGRVGSEDAENIVKLFAPVFDTEDLQYMPNYTAAVKMLLNGAPTSPFSMNLPPPMGHANPKLGEALRKLSAAKYGRPRMEVEAEIRKRHTTVAVTKQAAKPVTKIAGKTGAESGATPSRPSFLDEWLSKRTHRPAGLVPTDGQPVQPAQPMQTAQPMMQWQTVQRPQVSQQHSLPQQSGRLSQPMSQYSLQPVARPVQPVPQQSLYAAPQAPQAPTMPTRPANPTAQGAYSQPSSPNQPTDDGSGGFVINLH